MLIHNQRGLHFQLSWGIPSSYATQRWDPHEPVHACPKCGTPPQNFKLVYNTMHCVYFIYILIYFFENQTCLFVHYWDVIRPLDFTRWMLIHNQRGLHFQLSWGIPSSYATQRWDPQLPVHACPKYGTPPQNFKLVYNTMHCVYFIYVLI